MTLEDPAVGPPAFLRFSEDGINAVASFLKSRNSGAANTVAAATSAAEGLRAGGAAGFAGRDGCGEGGGGAIRPAR